MTAVTSTVHSQGRDTYKIVFDIDIDCEELLDAIGLDYTRSETDDTQNVVEIELNSAEAHDVLDQSLLTMTNEQTIACAVLNHELSEYTTSAVIETPTGDRIIFE